MENKYLHIEALIFASEHSISLQDIRAVLESVYNTAIDKLEIISCIEQIKQKYAAEEYAFELVEINNGFQFLTKSTFFSSVRLLQLHHSKKRLSQAALETLAIIAYKQPITKLEIEQIRTVNCDYTIQKLLEKELICISGKASSPGKPLLYSTGPLFMDHFGLKNSNDLPQLKDFSSNTNEIGEKAD